MSWAKYAARPVLDVRVWLRPMPKRFRLPDEASEAHVLVHDRTGRNGVPEEIWDMPLAEAALLRWEGQA
jgi:hypothetical protein